MNRETDQFVILASDGLWDVMTSEEAVQYVHAIMGGAMGAAREGDKWSDEHRDTPPTSSSSSSSSSDKATAGRTADGERPGEEPMEHSIKFEALDRVITYQKVGVKIFFWYQVQYFLLKLNELYLAAEGKNKKGGGRNLEKTAVLALVGQLKIEEIFFIFFYLSITVLHGRRR